MSKFDGFAHYEKLRPCTLQSCKESIKPIIFKPRNRPYNRHSESVQILIVQYYQLYQTLVAYYQSITPNNHHTTLVRTTSYQNPNYTSQTSLFTNPRSLKHQEHA